MKSYGNDNFQEEDFDYEEFTTSLFRVVPENHCLLCVNKLTGRPFVKEQGFHTLMPWIESKLVSKANTPVDYPKDTYKTSNGLELEIDVAITISIVDPIKYEYNSTDPLEELGIITRDILRVFIASKEDNELIRGKHSIDDFDAADVYDRFKEKYGVEVKEVYFKNIDIPQSLKDDFEKRIVQERENERKRLELNAKSELVDIETEIYKKGEAAKAEAEARRIREIISAVGDISEKQALELTKTMILADSDANLFVSMDDSSFNNKDKYLVSESVLERRKMRGRHRR